VKSEISIGDGGWSIVTIDSIIPVGYSPSIHTNAHSIPGVKMFRRPTWVVLAVVVVLAGGAATLWLLGVFKPKDNPPGPVADVEPRGEQPQRKPANAQERARCILTRFKEIAAAEPDNVQFQTDVRRFLCLAHAANGERDEALGAGNPQTPDERVRILEQVQRGQLLFDKTDDARKTTDMILAILEETTSDNRESKSLDLPILAGMAFARMRDQKGISRALMVRLPQFNPNHRSVLSDVLRVQLGLGDVDGVLQSVTSVPDSDRRSALISLMMILEEQGEPKILSADFYRRFLQQIPKQQSVNTPLNPLIPEHGVELQTAWAATQALIGLCSLGKHDDAAAYVIDLPITHTHRAGWLAAICLHRGQSGDVAGAIATAQRGGYLMLAAQLQIDAGQIEEAARNLRIVSLALDGDPPKDAAGDYHRLELLQKLALLQFRANQPTEGRRTGSKALDLAATMRFPQAGSISSFQFVKERAFAEVPSLEVEAAILAVSAGKLDAGIAVAEKHAGLRGIEDAVARLWTRIATLQWNAGDQASALLSFQKAISAGDATMAGRKVIKCNLAQIAAARARVGDVKGAYEILIPPPNLVTQDTFPLLYGDSKDEGITEVASALVRANDAKKALELIRAYQSSIGFGGARNQVLPRVTEQIEHVALVHAETGNLDDVFAMWFSNDGKSGIRQVDVPISVMRHAMSKGRFDLVLPRLRLYQGNLPSLKELLEPLAQAGQPREVQQLLEKVLDRFVDNGAEIQDMAGSCVVLFELMAQNGLPERIKGLVSRIKRPTHPGLLPSYVYVHFKYGEISEALAALRLVPPELNVKPLDEAMAVLAEEIAPRHPGGELLFPWEAGFQIERPGRKPSLVRELFHRETPSDDLNFKPDPPSEPSLTPEAVKDLAAKVTDSGSVAKEGGTQRWSLVTLYDGVGGRLREMRESGAIVMRNGQPMIFTLATDPQKGIERRVIAVQPKGQQASSEFLGTGKDQPAQWSVDAVTVGNKLYLSVTMWESKRLPGTGTMEIRSLVDGKWTVEHAGPYPQDIDGGGVRLAVVEGQPVAFYQGAGLAATFLERQADGKWRKTELKFPSDPDPSKVNPPRPLPVRPPPINCSSICVAGKEPMVAFCCLNINTPGPPSFGIYFAHRRDDVWTVSKIANTLGHTHHVGVVLHDGKPIIVAASDSGLQIYSQKGEKWEMQPSPLPKNTRVDSACVGTIAGKATILASESGKLHMLTVRGEGWADQSVITTASELTPLNVFEWEGKPAIVALAPSQINVWDLQYLVLLRPPGAGGDK
jgi:hypothetical protein